MDERYREQKIAARRLEQLVAASANVRTAVDHALAQINGQKGDPKSFDQLEKLFDEQWYRLAYWRVASDEINYRRFFDVNDLAAIRVEDPRVFDAVHRLVARLLEAGWVTGLRIDHPDGLRDPQAYFKNLQSLYRSSQSNNGDDARSIYILAEKILCGDEPLPPSWDVAGTTGYDLLNIIGRVQIDGEGLSELRTNYDRISGLSSKPAEIVYDSRRTVLLTTMASELHMLTAQLYRLAQQHRSSRDFTQPVLHQALREVIASMTVYRTYARNDSWDIDAKRLPHGDVGGPHGQTAKSHDVVRGARLHCLHLATGTPADAYFRPSRSTATVRPQIPTSQRPDRCERCGRYGVLPLLSARVAQRSRR